MQNGFHQKPHTDCILNVYCATNGWLIFRTLMSELKQKAISKTNNLDFFGTVEPSRFQQKGHNRYFFTRRALQKYDQTMTKENKSKHLKDFQLELEIGHNNQQLVIFSNCQHSNGTEKGDVNPSIISCAARYFLFLNTMEKL